MTDFAIHTATSSSGAAQRLRRLVARVARSFCREMIADDTYRALDELPDYLLRDLGLARSEIAFVAKAIASGHQGDGLNQTGGERTAMRRCPHVIFAES